MKNGKSLMKLPLLLGGITAMFLCNKINADSFTPNDTQNSYIPTSLTKKLLDDSSNIKTPIKASNKSENVYFKDKNLEKAVKLQLGLDSSTPINTENILKLTKLVSNSNNIKDLTGLEYAYNLGVVTFTDNDITNLDPLVHLDYLVSVGFAQNPNLTMEELLKLKNISALDLSNNPQMNDFSRLAQYENTLQWLVLRNSNIADTNFLNSLTNLQRLEIPNNKIKSTDLSLLPKLKMLTLSDNPLESLEVPERLEQLIIMNTKVSDLSFLNKAKDSLINLVIAKNNNIHDISIVSALPKLVQISLADTYDNITDYSPINNKSGLITLNLNNCDINTEQLQKLDALPRLSTLLLNKNSNFGNESKIKNLDFIKNHPWLTALALSGNSISDLSPLKAELPYLKDANFSDQSIILPTISSNLPPSNINFSNASGNLPSTINFNTPGEIIPITNNIVKIKWNNPGDNSLSFSDKEFSFSGTITQKII